MDPAREPREYDATVLFADLRGYTSLAERHAPREVLAMLNECFAALVACLEAEEAHLDKFLGDGLMAVFGLTDAVVDHPLQAARAGVAMQRAFSHLVNGLRREGWQALGLGVGLDSGTIVAGNIGIPGNSQFTVIGDVVNVASRLTAGAQPGEVVIGPGAGAALLSRLSLEPLGVIPIRGRSSPVKAWRLVSPYPLRPHHRLSTA